MTVSVHNPDQRPSRCDAPSIGMGSMTVSVHNPDQHMASLRQIIAQGRKRIGLLASSSAQDGNGERE